MVTYIVARKDILINILKETYAVREKFTSKNIIQ